MLVLGILFSLGLAILAVVVYVAERGRHRRAYPRGPLAVLVTVMLGLSIWAWIILH